MANVIDTKNANFIPARGTFVNVPDVQSGPFSLVPGDEANQLFLGWNSKIKFGNSYYSSLSFDLTFEEMTVRTNTFSICTVQYSNGIPVDAYISQISESEMEKLPDIEYISQAQWPHPKNVFKTNFVVASILPYNLDLKNTYGNSVVFGARESFSAVRNVFTSIQIIQTCYGFVTLTSPYV